jgi:surfactin synthase thioesterase subunit
VSFRAFASDLEPGPTDAAAIVLCFPHAGGGPDISRSWAATLEPDVCVRPIHFPGRRHQFERHPFAAFKRSPRPSCFPAILRIARAPGPVVIGQRGAGATVAFASIARS